MTTSLKALKKKAYRLGKRERELCNSILIEDGFDPDTQINMPAAPWDLLQTEICSYLGIDEVPPNLAAIDLLTRADYTKLINAYERGFGR